MTVLNDIRGDSLINAVFGNPALMGDLLHLPAAAMPEGRAQAAWATMLALHREGVAPDLLATVERLHASDGAAELLGMGWQNWLIGLCDGQMMTSMPVVVAQELIADHEKRELIRKLEFLQKHCSDDPHAIKRHLIEIASKLKPATSGIVAAAKENGNVFSEDQRIEYDALQAAYETLEAPVPEPRKTSPNWTVPEDGASAPRSGSKPADSRLMQNLCPWVKADNGGFDRLTDFTKAVTTGDSQRLMISGQSTINDPEGGFLVPTSHSWGVLNASLETEVVRPLARNVGMPTPEHTIADWDDYSHANGQIDGGLTGQWLVEGGEMDYKVAKTQQLKLVARKLGILTSATNEMVSDSPGFEGQFEGRMRKAVGWNLDRAFLITGNGVGMPTSVMNAASTITVSKETGQAAATILWANLTKMFSRLHPDCMNRAVWICSQTLIPQLLELHIPVGTGGTVVPVLTGSAGNYQILTRPVIFTEKCNALGTKGDIILADLSQYVVGMLPQAMRFDRSMHVKFLTDETVYRLLMRVEGQPTWRTAFTPATSGGSTLSWAVVLETRA